MNLVASPEQRQFAEAVGDLLAASEMTAVNRDWADGNPAAGLAVWRRLAGLGVTALAIPSRWGGLQAHPADLVIACEQLGYHALPGPVAESIAAVPTLLSLLDIGDRLPELASGATIATLGAPPHLPYAADAHLTGLVLLVDGSELRYGVPENEWSSVDSTRRVFALRAGGTLATGPTVAQARDRALDFGALACAAQLLGAGRALLDASVRYAGQRVQFGRPIGQFQAVKHRLADVAIGLEFARPLLYAAAVALAGNTATAGRDTSAAKVACADAAHRAARAALQVHGAIGYAEEGGIARWVTKVRALIPAWGNPSAHRARIMAALADGVLS